jgi:hypothetical protein
MPGCTQFKEGDTLVCEECGLILTVTKACNCGEEDNACSTETIMCCGQEMTKK